jgi:hypothetical protein
MSKHSKCYLCESGLDKIAAGLNKKLLGRSITRFYCIDCLANYLDVTVEDLLVRVEDFKLQGCKLFD